jgi:prepilin-type N-terminal cleavage/methylation domain-containing protein
MSRSLNALKDINATSRQTVGRSPRRGMTLVELLLAMSILTIMAGVMGGLALAVQQSNEFCQNQSTAIQHSRVTMERITRTVRQAYATGTFPGVAVTSDAVSGWTFPDTLLVWHPTGAAANPQGPPLIKELVIYCPDPDNPYQLLEITAPTDNRVIPLDSTLNTGAWPATLLALKRAATSKKVVLTDLVRVASSTSSNPLDTTNLRGQLRFEVDMYPSLAEWTSYQAGTLTWKNMSWAQGMYGSTSGLRQVSVRIELQLTPGLADGQPDPLGQQSTPFFGGASFCYGMAP